MIKIVYKTSLFKIKFINLSCFEFCQIFEYH